VTSGFSGHNALEKASAPEIALAEIIVLDHLLPLARSSSMCVLIHASLSLIDSLVLQKFPL